MPTSPCKRGEVPSPRHSVDARYFSCMIQTPSHVSSGALVW